MTRGDENSFNPLLISGKALERYFELNDALSEFSKLFNSDEKNDRAIAIVGATFLDILLEHTLRAFLVDGEKRSINYFSPINLSEPLAER